ncbi:MAG: efflux transporter periplasmic adaptor subunit, partial [Nostoc sp.]
MIAHIEISIIGKKAKYSLLWLIGLMAVGVLIIAITMSLKVLNRKTSKQDIAQTIPVEVKSVIVRITATGKVQPVQSVNVSPK